jgi:hypothetical protein
MTNSFIIRFCSISTCDLSACANSHSMLSRVCVCARVVRACVCGHNIFMYICLHVQVCMNEVTKHVSRHVSTPAAPAYHCFVGWLGALPAKTALGALPASGVKCVAVKTALRMLPAKKRQVRCQSALSEATHVTGGASRRRCAAGSLFPCPPLREEAMSVHISCVSLCCAPNARQRNVAYGKVPNAQSKNGRRWRPFALHARRGSSVYEPFW